ncbi:MAG: LLM class flavin-dependent oxidoreductase [Dehalococcoidia bacterium]
MSLLYEMQREAPGGVVNEAATIAEVLEQVELADRMGFHAVWFVEHHFLDTFSMSPCSEVILAALSQRTKNIRLGFGVVILPYHHPVRVAERVAMVDHLSGGRVEFGTGRSGVFEQVGMGIDPRDTREMWEESLAAIPRIWTEDEFSHDGKYWQVPARRVLPKPLQKPHPPIWVAALQPATYELAADRGIGVLSFAANAPSTVAPHIAAYRERIKGAKPVGAFVNNRWANFTVGHCGPDNGPARELAAHAIKTFFGPGRPYSAASEDTYRQLLAQWGGVPDHLEAAFKGYFGKPAEEAKVGSGDGLGQAAGENLAIWSRLDANTLADRGVLVAGDPESCIAAARLHEETGADELIMLMQTEVIPHAKVMRSIELFGTHVLPALSPAAAVSLA